MSSIELSPSVSLRWRAIRAGAWNILALFASQGMRLGGNLVMTRLLVPEMFSVMAIAGAVSMLLHLLSDVGLRQNIIQSPRGNDPLFLNTAWTVQLVRGVVLFGMTLLVAVAAWFAQVIELWPANSTYAAPELPAVLAVTGFTAIIYGLQSTKVDLAVRAFEQKKVVLVELATQVTALLAMLVLGYLYRSIWSLVIAGLVSAVVGTLLGHLMFEGPNNRLAWDRSALKELVDYGRWILLSSIAGVLATLGDRIWFGGSMSATEMGVYSIAVLILGAVQTGVLRLVGAVALPAFSEAARDTDKDRLRVLYYRSRLLLDAVLLFTCGLLLTMSPLIISWLYDSRYAGAGRMLAILSLSCFILRFTLAHQIWLALGLTKYQAMDNIIRIVSLWLLLPLLLAIGGVNLAIWGVALHTLPTLVLIYYVNRELGMFDWKRELAVLPILAVGALCGELLTLLFR
ncbi:oligosaccharide flippase family protein [Pseudomonas citronellolis]|uniref:oligosaccharide flippase family protein n=1 Tax=Pseudomonas citronellolis TaxID=53408 RepID=UPI0023E42676|nr:oligosaccharide flippase family protein [Pseudomonas citronellolis]MDF3933409.1 oligosaccharide flippase family protein [Pseudomonas citronellolis]